MQNALHRCFLSGNPASGPERSGSETAGCRLSGEKISGFFRKNLEIRIFCLPLHSQSSNAEIAQLVERNLAKVEVAGPSPVFRSRGGQKETPIESKKPCISLICKVFSFIFPLLLRQKAAILSRFHRSCSARTESRPRFRTSKWDNQGLFLLSFCGNRL